MRRDEMGRANCMNFREDNRFRVLMGKSEEMKPLG
jgi:hypothetical protein